MSDEQQIALSDEAKQALRDMFQQVPLHHLLGLEFTALSRELVEVTMPVRDSAFNSTGNLHGGSIATLIDVAAGTAAAMGSGFRPGEQTLVTADLHVRYLGRPHSDLVRAQAQVLRAGRQLIVVECRVLDGDGERVIAFADFSSMIVPLRGPLRPSSTAQATHPDL